MRALILVQQFKHLVCSPTALLLEKQLSSPLVPAWENYIQDRKVQERQTGKEKLSGKKTSVSTENNGFLSPSGVKLLALLGQSPLLLLSANRQSHKLLAGGSLFGNSYFFFVVYPDVWFKQSNGTLLVQACTDVQKPIETSLKRENPFPLH